MGTCIFVDGRGPCKVVAFSPAGMFSSAAHTVQFSRNEFQQEELELGDGGATYRALDAAEEESIEDEHAIPEPRLQSAADDGGRSEDPKGARQVCNACGICGAVGGMN